jgi:hypothetical protein
MSERKKIEDRLRKKEQEIVSMEEKIKATRIYVQALRDILKMLSSDVTETPEVDGEITLRSGSAVDQARRVILDKGVPVHIDDILAALGKDATREAKASLTSSLAAYVRRDEIFTRPAPNTFGLVELGHISSDEVSSGEPPADFGRQPVQTSGADDDISF